MKHIIMNRFQETILTHFLLSFASTNISISILIYWYILLYILYHSIHLITNRTWNNSNWISLLVCFHGKTNQIWKRNLLKKRRKRNFSEENIREKWKGWKFGEKYFSKSRTWWLNALNSRSSRNDTKLFQRLHADFLFLGFRPGESYLVYILSWIVWVE